MDQNSFCRRSMNISTVPTLASRMLIIISILCILVDNSANFCNLPNKTILMNYKILERLCSIVEMLPLFAHTDQQK